MNAPAVLKQKFLLRKKQQQQTTMTKPQTVVSRRNHKFSNRFYLGANVRFLECPAIGVAWIRQGSSLPPRTMPAVSRGAAGRQLQRPRAKQRGHTAPGQTIALSVPTKPQLRRHEAIPKGRFPAHGAGSQEHPGDEGHEPSSTGRQSHPRNPPACFHPAWTNKTTLERG